MFYILGAILTGLLAVCAWQDFTHRRIPNQIVAAIALLWVPYAFSWGPVGAGAALGTAALVLAAGVAVWRAGWLGAGDAKLLAALALWAGPDGLLTLLLVTALSGGAIVGVMWAAAPIELIGSALLIRLGAAHLCPSRPLLAPTPAGAGATASGRSIPYGVAIAIGGLVVLHGLFAR